MNSLRCCCPRVPVPDPEIGLRLGNDPSGASDVEAPRCEKLLAGFRLRGMRPEASRDRRLILRGPACQGRVRLVPFSTGRRSPPLAWAAGGGGRAPPEGPFSRRVVGEGAGSASLGFDASVPSGDSLLPLVSPNGAPHSSGTPPARRSWA